MQTLNSMNSIIPSITRMVGKKTAQLVQNMTQELIDTTPYCTGFAANSWYATPNAVKSKNDYIYLGDDVECLGQMPRKQIDLSGYDKIYGEWFVVNLAPYIRELNEGSSKKVAPGHPDVGWIEDIVMKHSLKGVNVL